VSLPILKGNEFLALLKRIGFHEIKTKGSHVRMKHNDGRVTTIPIHKGKDLPKGLIRKIIREDLQITIDEFFEIYKLYK